MYKKRISQKKSSLVVKGLTVCLVAAGALFAQPMSVQAQTKPRVAVFDPAIGEGIGTGIVSAIRELISSTLVNTDKFTIVERSLLDKVMKEQNFSNSGAVDESQASELGKLAGANKVIVSFISKSGARTMLSIKVIDVQSASIESQKTKMIPPGKDVLDEVKSLTLAAVGVKTGIRALFK